MRLVRSQYTVWFFRGMLTIRRHPCESNLNPLTRNNWGVSLVPAAVVIPAPIAYNKFVAAKKLIVGCWPQSAARRALVGRPSSWLWWLVNSHNKHLIHTPSNWAHRLRQWEPLDYREEVKGYVAVHCYHGLCRWINAQNMLFKTKYTVIKYIFANKSCASRTL